MKKKGNKSRYTELDKFKLIGVLRKIKIECYDDLYIETRSSYNIDDLLYALIDIFFKSLKPTESDNYIINILRAIDITTYEIMDAKIKIKEDASIKLDSLRDTYIDYCEKEHIAQNEEILKLISSLRDNLLCKDLFYAHLLPKEEVKEEEEIPGLSIEELMHEHNELNKNVSTIEEENKNLTKRLNTEQKNVQKKDQTIKSLEQQLKELNQELKALKAQDKKQINEIQKLTNENNELSEQNKTLSRDNEIMKRENGYIKKQNETLDEKVKEIEIKEKDEEQMRDLVDQLFEYIATRNVNIEDIYRNFSNVPAKKVRKAFEILNGMINISYTTINGERPTYKIYTPSIETNRTIMANPYRSSMDVLFISDLHLGSFSESDVRMFNAIYEYANLNNIKMIFNLGDFFSYDYLMGTNTKNKISYNEQILSLVVKNMPYDQNIHQFILGGNHDRRILKYGVDPLKVLESRRSDVHSLGYDDVIVRFGVDALHLHHIYKRLPEDVNHNFDDIEFMNEFNEYITQIGSQRINIFMDLFGHFHKYYLNEQDNYAFVPSLTNDRIKNGAIHLKINFINNRIDNIEVIPLTRRRNLNQTTSKILTKRSY